MKVKSSLFFLVLLAFTSVIAQKQDFEDIINAFETYKTPYKEVAHAHLNKSVYIKGEQLGFSTYVFEKKTRKPSLPSKNLYCIITDMKDNILQSKLLKLDNGFAHNIFPIDSTFTTGFYKFKAYTNWMNNFDEPNAYSEIFKVIDPDIENEKERVNSNNNLDAQFLPEGGHLVLGVETNIGVIVKNEEGKGESYVSGDVFDSQNNYITSFKTDQFGIGKFILTASEESKYIVKIKHKERNQTFEISDIKTKGITTHLSNSKDKLILEFKTNERTLIDILDKPYKITIHNGSNIRSIDVSFKNKSLIKVLNKEFLFPGINIFTLYNDWNKPILERMFFNYDGVEIIQSTNLDYKSEEDSTSIKIDINKIANQNTQLSKISISILPETTQSYAKNNNILSSILLQPYLNSYVQNAGYYFKDVNRRKKYELDNLLITQGWSSYNWDNTFKTPNSKEAFEKGISIKANVNKKQSGQYLVYPLKNNSSETFTLDESDRFFEQKELYPEGNEKYRVGFIGKRNIMDKPGLYVQFDPARIPLPNKNIFSPSIIPISNISNVKGISNFKDVFYPSNETVELEEILIETNRNEKRMKSIQNKLFGRVEFFNDKMRRPGLTLAAYLSRVGFLANDTNGILTIINPNPTSPNNPIPLVILDGVRLIDFSILANFSMQTVDYIEVNKSGIGYGLQGGGGVINIVTDPALIAKNSGIKNEVGTYEFPLTFAGEKKYYIPKYSMYNDSFFKNYGVIGWFPNTTVNSKGTINLTVYNPAKNNLKIFLEGVSSDGKFLSETHTIKLNH